METNNSETMPVRVLDDYTVIVADDGSLQGFFAEGHNLKKLYAVIEEKAKALVADPTTKEGASQIKAAARQLASVKTKIDNLGKQVVAELKNLPKVIDSNRKEFRDSMEALQEEIRRPVTEIEERRDRIVSVKETHAACMSLDSEGLAAKISELEKEQETVTPETWKESYEEAAAAYRGEISALETMKAAAEKREEEARELEELRRKQAEAERIIREQKIKEEAERKAKEEAEAKAAAEKARMEREKEEAERREAEAERAAKEAAQKLEDEAKKAYVAPQATAPSPAPAPAQKPSRWTPEMKAVNNAILADFTAIIENTLPEYIAGHSEPGYHLAAEGTAKKLVGAIIKGEIKNINVRY